MSDSKRDERILYRFFMWISVFFLLGMLVGMFISCSKPCNGSKSELATQYHQALSNCGGNPDCAIEIKRQYKERLEDVCD